MTEPSVGVRIHHLQHQRRPREVWDLVLAMVVRRAICPASKLGTVRAFGQSTLAEELGVAGADEDDLYAAMHWLPSARSGSRSGSRAGI